MLLPADPTEEELARDWTLSPADKLLVLHCRGEAHRLSCALQLCALRTYGRFVKAYETVPVRILNHLGRQLGLAPVLFLAPPHREATDLDHERRIREYLGFLSFDPAAQEELERWLLVGATEGLDAAERLRRAEEALHTWKVILPAPSTLQRLVASVSARAQQQLFEHIAGCLTPQIRQEIDALLQVPEGAQRSLFCRVQEYPPAASAVAITTRIEHYGFLRSLGIGHLDLSAVPAAQVRSLAQLAARYDVWALKRFAPAKRSALVTCFLVEIQKTLLDQVVALHDQFLTALLRKSRNSFERRYRDLRQRAKRGWDTLLRAVEILLSLEKPGADVLDELYRQIDKSALCEARNSCRAFQHLEEHGYVDALCAHYSHLRRYLPAFFGLPFQGEPGAEALLKGLALARALNARGAPALPWDAPLEFVPAAWCSALQQEDGTLRRGVWEIALAQAVRDALRSGDL
jgi:hypothetical protein